MGGEGWEVWRGEGGRDGGKCQSRFKVRLYPSEMQEMRGKKKSPSFFSFSLFCSSTRAWSHLSGIRDTCNHCFDSCVCCNQGRTPGNWRKDQRELEMNVAGSPSSRKEGRR